MTSGRVKGCTAGRRLKRHASPRRPKGLASLRRLGGWGVAAVFLLWQSLAAAVGCPDAAGVESSVPTAAPIASYRIIGSLDPERHVISGSVVIRWRNPSRSEISELFLHAYLNAFAHTRTRFLRASYDAHRVPASLGVPGSLSITSIVAPEFGKLDLLPGLAKHTPNDPEDSSDLRLQLPFTLAPAATLTLEVTFTATLPALIERSGFSGTFHAVAQWFPKLARLDENGRWHHFPYEPLAEFDSDFGTYDVTLDVPAQYTIAAPGIVDLETTGPGRRREHYCVSPAHDFAWFAWDKFVLDKARVGSVEIRHYASRDQTRNAQLTLETLRWGLEYFGRRYFPYPYSSLTIVHPPDAARAASGMEYPLLIATGGPWYLPYLGIRATESVTLHELAHQWFYGVVASDEYSYPVLDEGLASWAETQALRARFGMGSAVDTTWFKLSESAFRHVQARRYSRRGPAAIAANDFGDFGSVVGRVYARLPTLLETIQATYGGTGLDEALRAYATAYRFRHPTPANFLDSLQPHLHPSAHHALSVALLSDGWVDYSVTKVSSRWIPESGIFSNRILVERRGTLDFPVQLEVAFTNGEVVRRHFDSLEASNWIDWSYSSPVLAATIDPDHHISIDDNLENQTIRSERQVWHVRLASTLHLFLSAIGALNWP